MSSHVAVDEETSRVPGYTLPELVRSRYTELSPNERRIADQVLQLGAAVAAFTATELAQSAQVSKATVTRFVAKLGLDGFDAFRRIARDQHDPALGSPLQLMTDGLAATHGDLRLLMDKTYRADQANLTETYADLSLKDLDKAVELLCQSRSVVFADFRKQYALAYYAATLFRVIRPRVSTLPILGASPVDGTLDIGADDLVVMFPFRRPERDQDRLSRAVVSSGAALISIGDIWPSPTSGRADVRIRCRTESVGVFDSFTAPMSLINALFAATAARLGDDARARLAYLEVQHEQFETFDQPHR